LRDLKSSQMKKMLSAPHVLSEQGLLQAGWGGDGGGGDGGGGGEGKVAPKKS
jgi:hypothetical protein